MAITWKWEEKCGEAMFKEEDESTYNVDLYVGNCFLIMIHEFADQYALDAFFADEDHMERCLKNGIFNHGNEKLASIRINKAKCRNYKKIVELLCEYMDDIDIKVYKEGEQNWKEYKYAEPVISDEFMREIGESAVSYLVDKNMIFDFLADRYIELTDEQKSYLCIYDYEEDEDGLE